jgi:hypothetical protein
MHFSTKPSTQNLQALPQTSSLKHADGRTVTKTAPQALTKCHEPKARKWVRYYQNTPSVTDTAGQNSAVQPGPGKIHNEIGKV